MKFIQKGPEPESLSKYRRESHASYEGFAEKDALREALAKEQGYLCCYCMSRIAPKAERMKIEHWAPQSIHLSRTLDYRNMLGACRGGDGGPWEAHHCDTSKGDQTLTINPTDASCERKIRYNFVTGEVFSDDPDVQRDIDKTLNLNLAQLVRNRKQVLDDALKRMEQRREGEWSPKFLQDERERWSRKNSEGQNFEFCCVVVAYLDRKLLRAS